MRVREASKNNAP